jgi:hypothetical protein
MWLARLTELGPAAPLVRAAEGGPGPAGLHPAAELTAALPGAGGIDTDGTTGPGTGTGPGAPVLDAVTRLAGIPGLSPDLARTIIAKTGLDMSRFPPTPTWSRGPGCAPQPASPAQGPGPGRRSGRYLAARGPRPGRGQRLPHRHLPRRTLQLDRPPPRQGQKPRSPSPTPSWSSSGICSLTRPPGSPTSAPATTRPAPIRPQTPQPHPADPSARLHRCPPRPDSPHRP